MYTTLTQTVRQYHGDTLEDCLYQADDAGYMGVDDLGVTTQTCLDLFYSLNHQIMPTINRIITMKIK